MDKRTFERIESSEVVHIFHSNRVYPGSVLNMSEKGIFIGTDMEFLPDSVLTIVMKSEIVLIARVKWRNSAVDSSEGVGVELLNPLLSYLEIVRNCRREYLQEYVQLGMQIPAQEQWAAEHCSFEFDVASDRVIWHSRDGSSDGYPQYSLPRTVIEWMESIHPDDYAWVMKNYLDSVQSGEVACFEYRVLGKDGSCYRWEEEAAPVFSPEGELVKWIGSVTSSLLDGGEQY